MANKEDIKTRLLLWREEGYDDSDLDTHQSKNKKSFKGLVVRFRPWIVTFAFALTIVSNSILLVAYHSAKSQIYLCPSEYSEYLLSSVTTPLNNINNPQLESA